MSQEISELKQRVAALEAHVAALDGLRIEHQKLLERLFGLPTIQMGFIGTEGQVVTLKVTPPIVEEKHGTPTRARVHDRETAAVKTAGEQKLRALAEELNR